MSDAVTIQAMMSVQAVLLGWIGYKQFRNAQNIKKIEIATNSMKDALVKKTDEEAFARGAKSETDKNETIL
jgi:hypothetical protein